MKVFFHPRKASPRCTSGFTVSKRKQLPKGDFGITDFSWGSLSLWFIDKDKFTADERQAAYLSFVSDNLARKLIAEVEGKKP